MFIRNGIKSILRERGRTALFSLLIMLLTVTTILSLSVLLYSKAVMAACEESYRSIALIEHMGAEYPNEDEPDAAARGAAEELADATVLSVPGVTAWNRGNTAFATAAGYERRSGAMPYGNRAVIVVSQVSDPIHQWLKYDVYNNPITEEGSLIYYTCILKDAIYSRHGREGAYIDILTGTSGFVPEKGKSYVLNGSFMDTSGPAGKGAGFPVNGYAIFQVESFFYTDDLPHTDYAEGMEIPDAFLQAAEQYRIMNNYVHVFPCRDVNDVYAFHQNEIQLAEGEMPDPATPYSCVISHDLAAQLDLKPGDSFSMSGLQGTAEDRYKLTATGKEQTFTVSGITTDSTDYKGMVWAIAEDADTPLFGYLLGTVSLRNAEAQTAAETLQTLVPQQVRVTLLDQGYGAAVQPFREVEKTAVNVLMVCCVGIVAVLLLFAFLYVGRQQISVRIMVSMGTPGRCIALWFLSGALVICGASAILGTVAGTLLRPAVFRLIVAIAARQRDQFLWYSETVLGVVKEMAFDPRIPLWPNLLVVPAIVVLSLLFCLHFLRMARRGGTRKRGKSKVRLPRGKTSSVSLGGLGFALLSIRRGGLRSLVVPLVSLALTVTVLVLGGVYQGWQNELDDALENTQIEGMVISLNGRYYSGLVLPIYNLRTLLGIEGIEDVSVSYGYHYWRAEEEPGFTHGSYGRAHRLAWIDTQPELVALNSLSAAKEFYYTDPAVVWLDGWDETCLTDPDFTPLLNRIPAKAEEKLIPAVCSTEYLEARDMALGDTFSCLVQVEYGGGYLKEVPLNLQVVASYIQQGGKAQIYVPLACHVPLSLLNVAEDPGNIRDWDRFTFRTCRFHVPSAGQLDSVRQLLQAEGFSSVGHVSANRTTLLLRDAAFLRLAENMERNIAMGKVMSAVISLLVVLLGFIISWLMIFSRRREFALMRGCGVQKRQVFASFFLEQAILSLAGCLAGCLVLFRLYAGGVAQPLAAAAFLICYLLGTAISIRMIGKTNLMELLTVRE